MLVGIQSAGGIKALKKVDRGKVKDRSAAKVPGTENSAPTSGEGGTPSGGGGGGGLQDALQAALNKRKQKVSASGKFDFVSVLRMRVVGDEFVISDDKVKG